MATIPPTATSLTRLLDESARPVYAVDDRRRIVYCNAALAAWLGLDEERIVGRHVEYHSEPDEADDVVTEPTGPLAGLCPPPRALAGEQMGGTVSCVARDRRLLHRHADFLPLTSAADGSGGGVLAVLATNDLSQQQLADELADEPAADELHRAIRRFRRSQAGQYAIESLIGSSSAMRKVRAQVAAAAASGVNVLVRGPLGCGRSHVARAVHYHATHDTAARLLPIDCLVVTEDLMRRAIDSLAESARDKHPATLLLADLHKLPAAIQSQLVEALAARRLTARIVATIVTQPAAPPVADDESSVSADQLDPRLLDAVSTITVDVPSLADRLDDLPLLAQSFIEGCNRNNPKQIGGIRPEALDLLALYPWPGELDELRDLITAAHGASAGPEIAPADLPAIIHHAAHAASLPGRRAERIVLDDLLASVERELIERALARAGGNKTEAAESLGLTRPRLYRRLVRLGLVSKAADEEPQQ